MDKVNKKSILMVISTLDTGGAQRVISNITMHMPKEWDIDILLNDKESIRYPYRGKILSLGLPPQKDKTKLLYLAKVFIRRYFKLRKLKKGKKYTACISALTSANVLNVLTKNSDCKVVLTVHRSVSNDGIELGKIKDWINKTVICRTYNKADIVVTVSKGIERELIEKYGIMSQKVQTIYNGFELQNIQMLSQAKLNAEEKVWFSKNGNTIVTVGRLTLIKGQWHIIRALTEIKKRVPDTKLILLGEGILRERLEKLVFDLGLSEDVVFAGFQDNPFHILKNCDCFVSASLAEGMPCAHVEALCCGVPCVSTDVDMGVREILAPDTNPLYRICDNMEMAEYGVLCPICDEIFCDAYEPLTKEECYLAEAVIHILENPEVRKDYQKKGNLRVEEFEIEKVIKEWIALLET